MLKKLLSDKGLSTFIEVDGGIKLNNAADIISAGADILVMGSAFFNSGNYETIIKQFREIVGNR
jgi:ribulose-phosphate 3-epimerase